MSFLDVNTDVVGAAGANTAGTAESWRSWATQADTAFREAAVAVREAVVTSAVEGYASDWNPRLQGLATQIDALGRNTTSASNVVVSADGTSTTLLNQQGGVTTATGSQLNRPIVA